MVGYDYGYYGDNSLRFQAQVRSGNCADYYYATGTGRCVDIRVGYWCYFKGQLLGRVYRISAERMSVEVQDMDTGYRREFPDTFLRECEFTYKPKEKLMANDKIEVGDLVERLSYKDDGFGNVAPGETFIVSAIAGHSVFSNKNGQTFGHDICKLKLREKAKTMSQDSGKVGGNALSRLAKSLFNGRVKKFIEVGFLTSQLEVTEKFTRSAMAIVMEDLLAQKKDDTAAVELTVSEVGRRLEAQADEEIAEAKDAKNCCK